MGNNPNMDIKDTVAQNLSRLIAENPALGTLKKVKARSGVGAETVRRAQAGEGNITVEKLAGIARAFGVDVAYLVTDHGEALKNQNTKLGANCAVTQQLTSYDNKVAGAIKPKTKRQRAIDSLLDTVQQINDDGLERLIERAEVLSDSHPIAAKQTQK